ncbi:hypothetical protein JWJ88_17420 [Paracoccus methylovorus]|uniref:ATPase n=1 Tax=Paracoccus methylovorus TaxID=2812658 RepID=A0ABX7JKW2_9RHOB|nr:hypothetical protein [Paracoccus methylovorus]QRZ14745.1 hypothetical protein JWJ88_17420 [Paracoccus methylovorus]
MSDELTRCPCCEGEGYFYGDEKPPSPWGDADEIARLRAEVERLTGSLETVQRAARTLHAAGQEITRNAVAAAMGEAAALKEMDRSEYAAAASLDSERQANAMLTEALERTEAALADERAHADALMDDVRQRLSYDAETFHDQGAWDREDACLAIMKRIDLHRARRQG